VTDAGAARKWIGEAVAMAAHATLLAEFGGLAGVRDRNALASALARPRNLVAYAEPDIADLAAAYAYGIIRNHPFADGNKRTGYALALVFLLDNGFVFTGTDIDSVQVILSVAAGTTTEADLADWFRTHLQPA
jgi:death-on-curing protein